MRREKTGSTKTKSKRNPPRIPGSRNAAKPAAAQVRDSRETEVAQKVEIEALREYIRIQEKVNRGLRTYLGETGIVFRFIETISGYYSLDQILERLIEVIKELCGFDAAILRLNRSELEGVEIRKDLEPGLVERFRQVLEVDDRIYRWVFQQGHPVIVPAQFSRRLPEEFNGWSFMIAPLATAAEVLGRIELVFKRPQGSFTQQTFSILNVLLKHAAVIITNQRVYEKERRTAQKYMELDLLKKEVVNTTTHELRTPLTIINASSILLERNPGIPRPERQAMLQTIIRQCDRINQIVTEMFETAQLDEGQPVLKPEKISLAELTREVLADIPYDPRQVSFQLQLFPNLPSAWADRSGTYKILRNLIENAIKYSPLGGSIEISTRPGEDEKTLVWCIVDHGVGITEADQAKIFDQFYRVGDSTTRHVRGMGFGLYIVKKNAELNGGTVRVQSALGQGSTFTVSLPVYSQLAG